MEIPITFLDHPEGPSTLKIDKKIGKGKFTVYRAYSSARKTHYAFKVFPTNQLGTTHYLKEKLFSKLNHPNIIKHTPIFFQHPEFRAHLIEMAEFGDFFDIVENGTIRNNDQLIGAYFQQLLEGIEHMHSQGMAHLDLKLDNLMLGADFQLKIIDFDNSQLIADKRITVNGTKDYRAPEIVNRTCRDFAAADIFSMGMILYAFKAGEFPFLEEETERRGGLKNFRLFKTDREGFWRSKVEKFGDSVDFDEEFMELMNGMLEHEPENRWTIENIKESRWYKNIRLDGNNLKEIMTSKWDEMLRKKESKVQIY